MLSVVVYGRNDSHGYNLHKRAALSLNAIAHVLSSPDDEIIFVDYNTPDELPTFPETIADTLTRAAKERTRIIRVRPSYHAQFANDTKLVALESQARNIAVRRANPANRWILSTNTDMIFVPRDERGSLSAICETSPDGFYHLPRFELPEGFWERADRRDPEAMIEKMRVYGRRYHLNEIVYGGFDNLYEGPGDFQLFLREDLFRIRGFDERMILGWHVDTNIARRMRLLRGKVDTLFPKLSGYHCGHTRQATSLHGARRTENSLTTFVRETKDAAWTSGDWGAPAATFEEIRLADDRSRVFLAALDRAVPHEGPDVLESAYKEETYCEQGFEASHVLPHLADVLFNLPGGQSIFVVATDAELIEGFTRFAAEAPLNMKITLCSDEQSPGASAPFGAGFALASLEAGLRDADLVLLQYPNAAKCHERADREWFVQHALDAFIAIERERPAQDRRRIIIVNGTHNLLQETIGVSMDAAAMPYSARLRHGRVVDAPPFMHARADGGPERALHETTKRTRCFSELDRALLKRSIAADAGWERMALELIALADHADWACPALDIDEATLRHAKVSAQAKVLAAEGRAAIRPGRVGPRVNSPNRLCSGADWEDPTWCRLAERYFGERIYGLTERSRWSWERISLLHELGRRLPPKARPWILVAAEGPDPLAALLAHQGYRVAYASMAHLLGAEEVDWRRAFTIAGLVLPEIKPLGEIPIGVQFEALLAPSAALFMRGEEAFDTIWARLSPRLAPQAHVGASMLVHLNNASGGGALSHREFVNVLRADGWLGRRGFTGDADVDGTVPLDTLVKFAANDDAGGGAPGLSFGFGADAIVTIGQIWARHRANAAATGIMYPSHGLEPERKMERGALPHASAAVLEYAHAARQSASLHPTLFRHVHRNLKPFVVLPTQRDEAAGVESSRVAIPVNGIDTGFTLSLEFSQALEGSLTACVVCEKGEVLNGSVLANGAVLQIRFPAPKESSKAIVVLEVKDAAQLLSISALLNDSATAAPLRTAQASATDDPVPLPSEPERALAEQAQLDIDSWGSDKIAAPRTTVTEPLRDELAALGLSGLRIGYLNPWSDKAENQAFKSLAIAARELGQTLVHVTTSDEIEDEKLDFIVAVASTQAKMTNVPTFGCIHEPRTRFFSNPEYFTNLLSYDGFLTISPSLHSFLTSVAAGFGLKTSIGAYYNTPQANALTAPVCGLANSGKLRLCYFGTNWDPRGRPLFRLLSREPFTRIYGPPDSWMYLDRGYAGVAPFDGVSVQRTYARFGAGLVVLSKDHLLDDVISNRIFEITSVGAVAICPDIPWIRENYGDTVYYYDPHGSAQAIVSEIKAVMEGIGADPEAAQQKASAAKEIFERFFCAEKMLSNAIKYFDEWRRAGDPTSQEEEPLIDVIVRAGGRPIAMVQRALESIDNQRAGRFRILLVRYRELDLSPLLRTTWKRIVDINAIDEIGGGRAQTMVAGLKAVEAPYFALLDDDDYWLNNHIENLLGQVRKAPPGRAYAFSGYLAVGPADARGERRKIASCSQPTGSIFDILGCLQTGAFLASSELLRNVDLDGWTLQSAEDSLLHGSLIANGEPMFTWRPTMCWSADSEDGSNYVERPSRQQDVLECLTRLGPSINKIEQKFVSPSMPVWERLGSAVQAVFQDKTRAILESASLLVLEEGVVSTSIHEREDIEKRELSLAPAHMGEAAELIEGALHILPPAQPWAFGYHRTLQAEELFSGEQWVVLEFERANGSFGVGILHREGDFLTRMEVPASTLPMELWLHVRRPEEAASIVVQNWARPSTEPARLRRMWAAQIALDFRKRA